MYSQSNHISHRQPERARPLFGLVAGFLAAVLLGASVVAFGGTI